VQLHNSSAKYYTLQMTFYDRKRELAWLDEWYGREGGRLLIVYGRRRVGKTALLDHWVSTRKPMSIFWTAEQKSSTALLRSFSHEIRRHIAPSEPIPDEFTYPTWEMALNEIARIAETPLKRLAVVIDEFTYAIAAEPSLPSVLQRLWDHTLKKRNLLLVLTGSHAGMIHREMLAYRSPLYNRASRAIHVQPLPFVTLHDFFPTASAEHRVTLYGCVGGIPLYLDLLPRTATLDEHLDSIVASDVMLDDAGALLRDQLGEPRNYVAIVESIAYGFNRTTEIAKMAGLKESNVNKYLDVLESLDIVQRRVPATVSQPAKSKQGRYFVADAYLRFYYRFISPQRSLIERGRTRQARENIARHLSEWVGTHAFEELAREWVIQQADAGRLSFVPRRVGSYWERKGRQIDVVAVNEDDHHILLGECKWTQEQISPRIVRELIEDKAPTVTIDWSKPWRVTYAFFSKAGFTAEARAVAHEAAKGHECLWVDLSRLDKELGE